MKIEQAFVSYRDFGSIYPNNHLSMGPICCNINVSASARLVLFSTVTLMTHLPGPYDSLKASLIFCMLNVSRKIGPFESSLIYVRLAYTQCAFVLSPSCPRMTIPNMADLG